MSTIRIFCLCLVFIFIIGYTHHQGCSMIVRGDDVRMNCIFMDTASGAIKCSEGKEIPEAINPHTTSSHSEFFLK